MRASWKQHTSAFHAHFGGRSKVDILDIDRQPKYHHSQISSVPKRPELSAHLFSVNAGMQAPKQPDYKRHAYAARVAT